MALYRHFIQGNYDGALELWHRTRLSNMFFWSHAFNPSVKAVCNMMGHDVGQCRLPVVPLEGAALDESSESLEPLRNKPAFQ